MTDANDPVDAGPGYARANGWDREYEVFCDFDLPTYVGPSTFAKLPWVTDPAELRRRGVDVAIVGAPFDETNIVLAWIERSHALIHRKVREVLSVDIDVLDPGMVPGTGTPQPGGLLTRELLRAIRRIVGAVELAGMDIAEVSPPYDHAEVTATSANRCAMEACAALAARQAAGTPFRYAGRGTPPA